MTHHDKNKIYPEYIIYKICSDECDEFYIGSTRNIVQRRKTHKSSCKNENDGGYNTKKSKTIREFGGWENWRLVPIEKMENVSRFEAECREEVVRVELQAKMNSIRASCGGMSKNEYKAEYYKENREQIIKKQNEKCECECGGRFTKTNKALHYKSKIHKLYLEQIE